MRTRVEAIILTTKSLQNHVVLQKRQYSNESRVSPNRWIISPNLQKQLFEKVCKLDFLVERFFMQAIHQNNSKRDLNLWKFILI